MSLRPLYIILTAIALSCSLFIGVQRWRVEARNRAVGLVLDMDELRSLSEGSGVGLLSLLRRFHEAGATSVAISEETLASLRDKGRIALLTRDLLSATFPQVSSDKSLDKGDDLFLVTSSQEVCDKVLRFLPEKLPITPHTVYREAKSSLVIIGLPGSKELVDLIGLGMPADEVLLAREAGVEVVGRLYNYPSAKTSAINAMLRDLHTQNVKNAIFAADEIAGFKDLLKYTAESMRKYGVTYGSVEFAKQRGDTNLAEALHSRIVRVHSISAIEMTRLSPADAVERFVRAAHERNVRLCYVRLFPQMKKDAVEDNREYIHSLGIGLRQGGYRLASAHPFEEFHAAPVLLALISLGVMGAALWLLDELVTLPAKWATMLLLGGFVVACGGLAVAPTMFVKVIALASACIFPSLGYCLCGIDVALHDKAGERDGPGEDSPFGRGVICLLKCSGMTLAGAAMVVGLLADVRFMVKTDQFAGIKLSQAVPLMVASCLVVTDLLSTRGAAWRDRWQAARSQLDKFLCQPVLVGFATLGIMGLAFAALWLARTGNEPGVEVSPLELKFRSLLEHLLIARPRTKEFLIGHPAFLLAAALSTKGYRYWLIPLALLGLVGQTSMLNTFCHIHTPLTLSAFRTLNGLWLGILLGGILYWLSSRKQRDSRES